MTRKLASAASARVPPFAKPDGVPDSPAAEHAVHLQRSFGRAEIAFKRRDGRTVLDHLYQSGCAKVRLPAQLAGAGADAVLINTAGGLTDGDRVKTSVNWGEHTQATVTSQAAERIYRSRGQPAQIRAQLAVQDGAQAAWLPQETILFDGGRFERRTEADVAAAGCLLACESLVLGRMAGGERIVGGSVLDTWRVRYADKLVFADGCKLNGAIQTQLARPVTGNGAGAMATVLVIDRDAACLLSPAREALESAAGYAAASAIGPVLVARLLGRDGAELRRDLMRLLETLLGKLRPLAAASLLPRVWRI